MLTEQLDWEKTDGMMPAIVQHAVSGEVLMLGYMNKEALEKTEATGKVTFYSRTKQRLWTKGETSGNVLNVVSITPDCDNDTLLVLANGQADNGEIVQGPFKLNTRNRTLEKNGGRIKLTQVEYSIMKLLMDNPGRALSREDILNTVWGRDYFGELKIVDVNIRRLRIKIEDNPTNPTYITTVWGYGYKWGF